VYDDFINCGAFTGDTVKNLVKNIGKITKISCVEPDQSSFLELVDYSINHSAQIADQIHLFPVALGNKTQKISFKSSLGLCSEIGEGLGANTIQCVRLDDILPNASPTYISMDLEGYEVMALDGAANMIARAKPNLAISIYHQINHLWEIILKIEDYQLKYDFYLRNYTGFTYETILYCKK
jgi:FkbM family methyltransferase